MGVVAGDPTLKVSDKVLGLLFESAYFLFEDQPLACGLVLENFALAEAVVVGRFEELEPLHDLRLLVEVNFLGGHYS
jgi:hypothetical protein